MDINSIVSVSLLAVLNISKNGIDMLLYIVGVAKEVESECRKEMGGSRPFAFECMFAPTTEGKTGTEKFHEKAQAIAFMTSEHLSFPTEIEVSAITALTVFEKFLYMMGISRIFTLFINSPAKGHFFVPPVVDLNLSMGNSCSRHIEKERFSPISWNGHRYGVGAKKSFPPTRDNATPSCIGEGHANHVFTSSHLSPETSNSEVV